MREQASKAAHGVGLHAHLLQFGADFQDDPQLQRVLAPTAARARFSNQAAQLCRWASPTAQLCRWAFQTQRLNYASGIVHLIWAPT